MSTSTSVSSSGVSTSATSGIALSTFSSSADDESSRKPSPLINEEKAEDVAEEESPYVDSLFSFEELKQPDFFRAILAEFLATLFFVGFSVAGGNTIAKSFAGEPGQELIVAVFYHMILILLVIYAFAALSGAHFNPAITLAVVFTRRITILRCVAYVAAQMLGAIVGAALIEGTITGKGSSSAGLIIPPDAHEAFLMEAFITSGLVFGAFASAFDPRGWGRLGPLAISITVGINIVAGHAVSGGVMNPARAFGPAVTAGEFKDHWVYWAGPVLGGVSGATIYEYLFMQRVHRRAKNVPSLSGDNHGKQHQD